MVNAMTIADDALAIFKYGCGYIWGTSGEIWTQKDQWEIEDRYNSNQSRYSDLWGSAKYGSKWIGRPVYDCSGLVMRILKNHGISVAHGSNSQYNDACKETGRLIKGQREDGKELVPGTAVFLYNAQKDNRHHVGIYVGGGEVVEAKGGYYGVIKSKVSTWDEWGELKRVDYKNGGTDDMLLKKGSRGADVIKLQNLLNEHGYNLAADGIFGNDTLKAVKAFQEMNGLTADGIVGDLTWTALNASTGVSNGVVDAAKGFIIRLDKSAFEALKKAVEGAENG